MQTSAWPAAALGSEQALWMSEHGLFSVGIRPTIDSILDGVGGAMSQPDSTTMDTIDWSEFVDQVSQAIALPIPPECKPGVVANLERTQAIAQLVLEFPLDPIPTLAPTFQP